MPASVSAFSAPLAEPGFTMVGADLAPGADLDALSRELLAVVEGRVVGCAALRRVEDGTCELKRVYVRPVARGMDLGRKLVEEMLRVAREAGYRRMCLDVLPEFVAAQRLYESLGFVTAEPVSFNPVPGTRFLALDL